MKLELIPNVRHAMRMVSIQVAALAVAWGSMPQDLQQAVLTAIGVPEHRVPAVFGAMFLLGRLVRQRKTEGAPE